MKLRLAIASTLLAGTLLLCPAPVHSQNPPRLTITVFRYHGAEATAGRQAYESFLGVLDDKIRNLGQEMSLSHPEASYLQRLWIFESSDRAPALARLADFATQSGSLGLLSGTVFSATDVSLVRSRFFLGELKGSLLRESVSLELGIEPSEFGSIRDSHSAVTLYALAMDAKRLSLPKTVVVDCLSRAYSITSDLSKDDPGVAELRKAIELEFRVLGAP